MVTRSRRVESDHPDDRRAGAFGRLSPSESRVTHLARGRGVAKKAVATLSGSVEQLLQKLVAEKAAESVQGIATVIASITVQPRPSHAERETLRRQGREELP